MDLFLDAEWFIGNDVFLIGWSRGRKQFGQLYDDTLTLDHFQELLDETTGIIYFYGPDIGVIEKFFGIDIRTMYHCVNLLKVFKDVLPGMQRYKLANIEKLYGIKRNRLEYKTNIFTIFRDWRKPQLRSLVLQYNREDVINLAKLKEIIFAQYDVADEYLLQVKLAGTGPVELVKDYVYLLPADVYRGKYFGRGSTGVAENDPNVTAQLVIDAKFNGDKVALYRMQVLMHDVVKSLKFDIVTSVNGRDSKFHLAGALAQGIANRLKSPYRSVLYNNNTSCAAEVKGKSILIVDDVIYKGRTMQAAIQAAMYQRPQSIFFLAFGKSKRFAY